MELKDVLKQIGLNEKEARVYLALLELGTGTAFNVAKKARLKRPTTYVILEKLKQSGLASTIRNQKSAKFSPLEPAKLYHYYKDKEQALKKALPELEAVYNLRPAKPQVRLFEGHEGMKSLYYEAHEYLKSGQEVIFFGGLGNVNPYLKEQFIEWKKVIHANKLTHGREIIAADELGRAYQKEMQDVRKRYEIRLIPKEFGLATTDFFVYGDNLILTEAHKDIFATMITHKNLVHDFKVLFEMAWQAAKS